jgi:hypothetical protein
MGYARPTLGRLIIMRDLFESQLLLKSSTHLLEDLSLCGVPYGCEASQFPVERVSQVTLAPIVQSFSWSSELGASYQDANGRTLSLSEVIKNAIQFSGTLHFPENVSFGFKNGRVSSFALYGTSLYVFRYIKSYAHFVNEFEAADVVIRKETFGDLMGYEHYYKKSRKLASWDEMGKKVALINFGVSHHALEPSLLSNVKDPMLPA